MAKKKKLISPTSAPAGMPSLTAEQSQIIQRLIKELIAQEPKESWPIPAPVDVALWKQEDGRLASAFFFSHSVDMSQNAYQFLVPMTLEVAQDAVLRGQEAIWEWLRDASAWICTLAVAKDFVMPDLIMLQIADVVRVHEADKDDAFLTRIREDAMKLALSTAVGEAVTA